METREGALSHLKVLDFGRHIAGPLAARLMADLGADVVKVERPDGGDPARRFGPFPGDLPHPERGGTFLYLNTNKRGITLNLKEPAGAAIARRLAAEADVVVENFRPGVMDRLGLGYGALCRDNPRLVMVSITNAGQTGPYRDYRMTDIVVQALGGLMSVTGMNGREPLREALSQAQMWGGLMGAAAAMTGVAAVHTTGRGDHMDVSMMEVIASGLQATTVLYSFAGAERRREERPEGISNVFRCKDGYIVPMATEWEAFANMLGVEALHDRRFQTPLGRAQNADALNGVLAERFVRSGRHELFHLGQEWGFPFGIVQDPGDLAGCPQLEARGFWGEIEHPVAGRLRYPAGLVRMTEGSPSLRRPAPMLGEHNEEVLCGALGLSRRDLVVLARTGVV